MTLDELISEWAKDSTIDPTELGEESLKTAKLHSKYYEIYLKEKFKLNKLEAEYDELYNEKRDFYVDGPSKEQIEKGWTLPPRGQILKAEVERYLKADKDLIHFKLKTATQKEKVNFLLDVISFLNYNRKGIIHNAIEWNRWIQGG